MMTTMAALLAGMPLMLGHGTGSELRQPLGYAMVGGLILSQALTLYTTPVVFLYLDRFNRWLSSACTSASARQARAVQHRTRSRSRGLADMARMRTRLMPCRIEVARA